MIEFIFRNKQFSGSNVPNVIKAVPKAGIAGLGVTVLGTGAGAMIARSRAKRSAQAKGLTPGTPEYNRYVRNRTLVGAGVGTLAGTIVGGGVSAGVMGHGMVKNVKADLKNPSNSTSIAKVGSVIKKPTAGMNPKAALTISSNQIKNESLNSFAARFRDTSKPLLDF